MKLTIPLITSKKIEDQENLANEAANNLIRHVIGLLINNMVKKLEIEGIDQDKTDLLWEKHVLYEKFRFLEERIWYNGFSGVALIERFGGDKNDKFDIMVPDHISFVTANERQEITKVVFMTKKIEAQGTAAMFYQFITYEYRNGVAYRSGSLKRTTGNTQTEVSVKEANSELKDTNQPIFTIIPEGPVTIVKKIPFVLFKNDQSSHSIMDLVGGELKRYKDTLHKYWIDLWQGGTGLLIDTAGGGRYKDKEKKLENDFIKKSPIKTITGGLNDNGIRDMVEYISNTPYGEVYNSQLRTIKETIFKILQVPDYNSADKGTAQVQSSEVTANLSGKMNSLEARIEYRNMGYTKLYKLIGSIMGLPTDSIKATIPRDKIEDIVKTNDPQAQNNLNNSNPELKNEEVKNEG